MEWTLHEIARRVAGRVQGDGEIVITGAAALGDAHAGDITLVIDGGRAAEAARSAASAVVAPRGLALTGKPWIEVDDVHEAFAAVVRLFRPERLARQAGISPLATVSDTARIDATADIRAAAVIGDEVEIGPGCVVHAGACLMAGCKLGRDIVVFPNAVLYEDTIVGDRVLIHAGAVLGMHGFGFETIGGRHYRCPHLGYVRIEDDVDIGAGTTIERGTYGPTVISQGTKLDDQVMIGRDCRIGPHNIFCSQVGISGSTTGHYVIMAGQVGVRDHVHIGDLAVLAPQSGVKGNLTGCARYFGIPARPEREMALIWSSWSKLPELRRQVRDLMRELERMRTEAAGMKNDAA